MHAVRLEGENIGPWRGPFKFDFVLGAVGIFGPNGSGKSTLCEMMLCALTNDWTRVAPLKLSVINNQADKKAPAWVKFTFEVGGVTCSVRRDIKPVGNELIVGSEKAITNDKEIQQRLAKIGIEGQLLAQCIFLEQNAIHEFLELPPGDRAKVYQALNHTGDCETINAVLGEMLNKDKELCVAIEDNSDELGQRLSELQQKQEDLDGQKTSQAGYLLSDKNRIAAETLLARNVRYEALSLKWPKLETELVKAEEAAKIAVELEAAAVEECKAQEQKVGEHTPIYLKASVALKQWDAFQSGQQIKQSRLKKRDELMVSLQKKPPVLPVDVHDKAASCRESRSSLRRELEEAQARLKMFDDTGKVKCPTCGTPVERLVDMLQLCNGVVREYPQKIAACTQAIESLDASLKARADYDNWREVEETKLKSVEAALAETLDKDEPEGDRHTMQAAVDAYNNLLQKLDIVRHKLRRLVPQAATCKTTETMLRKQQGDMTTEMQQLYIEPARLQSVTKRLQQHMDASTIIANIDGQLTQIAEEQANVTGQLDQLKARLQRQAKVQAMVEILERVRDATHRNALPQRVAQVNLHRMEGAINAGLELFGSPFWISTKDNLDFLIYKPGEPGGQAVQQTSIGQRVLLAIAFWGASHSLYSTDLGMLVLDEPSANLDAANRKYLAEAIARLTKSVRDKRQVLVISHAEELAGSFDQVIDLTCKP
jgi:DNA repair exonuclease SbcCD ATPase subunit